MDLLESLRMTAGYQRTDRDLEGFVQEMTTERLNATIEFRTTQARSSGIPLRRRSSIFNHQTHHRTS